MLISFLVCYRRSKRLKEVEQRRVDDTETGQDESYCKEQEQKEYNEKELEYNRIVIEESCGTKLEAKAGDGIVTYKPGIQANVTFEQMIVTCHL